MNRTSGSDGESVSVHNRQMSGTPTLPIDWGSVRAVGLDLMDTLIHDPFREVIPRVSGMTLEELGRRRDVAAFHAFELDRISEEEFGERFFLPAEGCGLDIGRLWAELDRGYRFLDGMEILITELAARLPILILSNCSRWYERVRNRFELDRFVAQHYASFRVGARKPDPLYFERVLARARLAPRQLLFVDDRPVNVAAAHAAGLPALQFSGARRLRRELAPLLARPLRGGL